MTALIVDDSRYARNLIKSYLEEMPERWHIYEAEDGTDALNFLQQKFNDGGSVELALIDWNMPKMLGIDCLRAIKASEQFKEIKVIIVTSDGSAPNVVEAIKAGASDFLVKRIDPVLLKEKVHRLFRDVLPKRRPL
jgi:two-component system chemotaxis response regulator CheY